jgi:hypothetical protein
MATKVTTGLLSDNSVTDAKLSATITATTQSDSDNTTKVATTAFVSTAIANLADSAPSTLNTLNELAAALGDDANYATTTTNAIAAKAPLASPSLTGNVGIGQSSPSSFDAGANNLVIGATSDTNSGLTIASSGSGIIYFADGTSGDTAYRGTIAYGHADDAMIFRTGGFTERMRINSSGNVGIGETSPANLLHVKVSDAGIAPHPSAQIVLERDGTNYLQFLTTAAGTSGLLFGDTNDIDVSKIYVDHNTTKMTFVSETSETMVLHGPKVGIGTPNPQKPLHIIGPDGTTSLTEGNSRTALFIENAGATYVNLASSNSANAAIFFSDADANNRGALLYKHASDSLAFTTAGTERMNIYNNGLTTIDASTGSSVGNLRVKGTSGHSYIGVSRATASQGEVGYTWNNNTSNVWWNYLSASSSILQWYATSGTKMTLDNSSGDLYVTAGNVKVSSGKGIDFSSAGNAGGMTSELLDDYEEGTFDPSFTTTSGSITPYSSYNTFAYTKVGRVVTITGTMATQSVSSPTGQLTFGNLPFSLASDTPNRASLTRPSIHIYSTGSGAPTQNKYYSAFIAFGHTSNNGVVFATYNSTHDENIADWFAAGSDMFVNFSYITNT